MHKGAELAAEVRRVAHGAVPVADNGLGDQGGEVVVVVPAHALDGNGNVRRWHGVVTDADLGADEVGSLLLGRGDAALRRWRAIGHLGKVLLCELDQLLVGDATGADEHHAVCSVVGLDVVDEVVAGNALNVLLWAEDGAAERLALEGGGVQVVEYNLFELLVNLLLFPENNITLAFNGGALELRVLENVGENIDGGRDIGVEGLGVVDSVLALHIVSGCLAVDLPMKHTDV